MKEIEDRAKELYEELCTTYCEDECSQEARDEDIKTIIAFLHQTRLEALAEASEECVKLSNDYEVIREDSRSEGCLDCANAIDNLKAPQIRTLAKKEEKDNG